MENKKCVVFTATNWKSNTALCWDITDKKHPILKQQWICQQTGAAEWRDIPKIDFNLL